MKTCASCHQLKPLTDFHKQTAAADGHRPKCKQCYKEYYLANRERILEYHRINNQRPERKAKNAEWCRRWYQKRKSQKGSRTQQYRQANPEKAKAHSLVRSAVRNKTLIPLPCEKCGDVRSNGHHADYTKPLDVQWLCAKHHAEAHHPNIEGGSILS